MEILDLFAVVQKTCLPGVWSKGMALSRAGAVIFDLKSKDEITLRVRSQDHPVSRKVTLWPQDEDWYCDCGFQQDVCQHVAAAVITLKTTPEILTQGNSARSKSAQVNYRFTRDVGRLVFERRIVQPDGREEILTQSLVSWVGGIESGRIISVPVAATREDYAVDGALNGSYRGEISLSTMPPLLKALSRCSNIQLDGKPIQVSSKPHQVQGRLTDEGAGFRLQLVEEKPVTEFFQNGAVLCGETLKAFQQINFTVEEKKILSGLGTFFHPTEVYQLVVNLLPELEKKIPIENLSKKLPKPISVSPRVILEMEKSADSQILSVIPKIIYGDPNEVDLRFILPDPVAEKALIRKLQSELQLSPGQRVQFEGLEAVNFVLRSKAWEAQGEGIKAFSLHGPLKPVFHLDEKKLEFSFQTGDTAQKSDAKKVFQAWRENQDYVPLFGGGWAPLPKDWLARYGERIQAILAAQEGFKEMPTYQIPEVISLCEELHEPYPDALKNIKELLDHVDKIEDAKLPSDLSVTLRTYQKAGVNWLCFLRKARMGAMLADDMGLGKTLQALCAIQGRTLIIVPTSVLFSWMQQIRQFRPGLTCSLYHGSQRKIELNSDITLIPYSILRLDRELITKVQWDTIIVDEAQTIKNPDSQVSKAVHSLRSSFRIALSGTPLENRLSDLWSQFQFINPGLLGSIESFEEQFGGPIARGDNEALRQLKTKIRPFILRRMKADVAPELPQKTEVVLTCELSNEEREVYDSILASTRKEVIEKLEMGGSIFAALELLLRLRQACCHPALIPGQRLTRSAKVDLLVETLEQSIALGHRALVFSQWTSYLDLIEPQLQLAGLTFSRLDGTTQNREEIVNEFQTTPFPSVMLISLKAGGVGLTLTAADHIFLMDPWWNPAVESQAADRAHRIGQTNPVLVQRLVAEDTIEERIMSLQKSKSELASAVLDGAGTASAISREDILALLS